MTTRKTSAILSGGVWDVANQWSKTKLLALDTCAYKFFRAYVLGERRPPTAAMAFGNAWDGMADGYYREKAETGIDRPAHDAQELWREAFEQEACQIGDWSDDMASMIDEGAELALRWHPIAETVQPLAVQVPFSIELPGPDQPVFRLTGKIDQIVRSTREPGDAPVFGIDDKTTSRRWSERELWSSLDALSYTIGIRHGLHFKAQQVDAAGNRLFEYHVAVRLKEPVMQRLQRPVSDADVDGFMRYVILQRQRVIDSYRSGTWTPNRKSFLCSRRWCGWWEECEKEWGGRVPN